MSTKGHNTSDTHVHTHSHTNRKIAPSPLSHCVLAHAQNDQSSVVDVVQTATVRQISSPAMAVERSSLLLRRQLAGIK